MSSYHDYYVDCRKTFAHFNADTYSRYSAGQKTNFFDSQEVMMLTQFSFW